MLIKKRDLKQTIIAVISSLIVLTAVTFGFKLYHDSNYVKSEYDRVCPQNYGDPISLDRCYWPHRFEEKTLQNAINTELLAIFVIPALLFFLAKKK